MISGQDGPDQEDFTMKSLLQMAILGGTIWLAALGSNTNAIAQTSGASCSRDSLKSIADKYFAALEAHNPAGLPIASNVKYTENGVELPVGKGFWETAGKTLIRRDLIDTQKCGTHSNIVIEEKYTAPKTVAQAAKPAAKSAFPGMAVKLPADGTIRPILFGVRLRVEKEKITEIETIIARETEFAFNAAGVLATKDQDWGSILPPEQRSSRLAMIAAADDYYDMFAKEPMVRTPFASPCDRWENGTQTTVKMSGVNAPGLENMVEHDCSPKGLVITNHGSRRFLVDTEAGLVVAYVLFAGGLPDFHMFKMRNGKVELIQAVIGSGAKSMGWPIQPICKN
jgi:hypothetical protein